MATTKEFMEKVSENCNNKPWKERVPYLLKQLERLHVALCEERVKDRVKDAEELVMEHLDFLRELCEEVRKF